MRFVKFIREIFFIVTLLSVLHMPLSAAAETGISQANDVSAIAYNAELIVNRYLTALKMGDVDSIRNLIGKDFLEQRKTLLSNPSYGQKLQTIYQDAVFEIKGNEVLGAGAVAVNVDIIFSNMSHSKYQFLLETIKDSDIRIVEENEMF